ncbi:MAG: hypothetical protein IJO37_02740 [Ruminiclostridium sp.]|nr:hypothetical protein [Ruminiclostridium sp.]
MAKNKQYETYAYLDQLNTEQLEELLRADFASEGQKNEEIIFQILSILEKREQESSTGRCPDVEQAWAEFQTYYAILEGEEQSLYPDGCIQAPPKKDSAAVVRLKQCLKSAAVVAVWAVVIFCGMLAGEACGHEPFATLGLWSQEAELINSHFDLMMYMGK